MSLRKNQRLWSITTSSRINLFFLLVHLALPSVSHAFLVDKVAGIVNSDVVLLSEVERFRKTVGLRKELDPLFGFTGDIGDPKTVKDEKILDFLIQERLVGQTFKKSDNEVETEITTVQNNIHFTREQLKDYLKSQGYSLEEYFELMRVALQKRDLLDREIRNRVTISDEDVRNYFYNVTAKNEAIPLEYSIQLITIENKNYKDSKAALHAAQDALRSIKHGEPFVEVAKRLQIDASGPPIDLGYLASDQLKEPIKSIARKLQIGEMSDVVKASDGYFIVKLSDARSTESQKFIELKEQIREQLAKEEYRKQLTLWAERARNNAYVRTNSLHI